MTTTIASACKASKFSKHFTIVVGIYDANTQIHIDRSVCMVETRSSFRAECIAIENAKHEMLRRSCKQWVSRYGITATQFKAMLDDHVIAPLESYTFKVERVEVSECQTR